MLTNFKFKWLHVAMVPILESAGLQHIMTRIGPDRELVLGGTVQPRSRSHCWHLEKIADAYTEKRRMPNTSFHSL